ncbi:MAG: choice-of-anchor B family protein, partial [Bacteroidetes bacterium]|nr:choice-of-anchor B family protein [Bacteroidota bacterium]
MRKSLALYLFAFLAVSPTWANPIDLADRFGRAITAGDGYLFISESGGFETHGMVHVYVRGDDQKWVWKNSLHGQAHVGDRFGHTIGYGDGTLAVADQSTVYVFELDPETDHFVQTDQLESGDNSTFGTALALDDGWLAIGSSQADGSDGQVHLFQKNPEGTWVKRTILEEPGESSVSMYGSALSMDQGRLLIGSPGLCMAYLYEHQADEWQLSATLPCGELSAESMYGVTLDLRGERAVIGAPQHNSRKGVVVVWHHAEDSGWERIKILAPEDNAPGFFFGSQVEIQDPLRIVIGFPVFGSRDAEENLRVYTVREGEDSKPEYTTVPGIAFSPMSTVAVDGSVMAVGSPNAAYGEGIAELLEFDGSAWEMVQELFYVHEHMPRKADILCDDGQAEGFDCGLVDLISFLPNEEMEMNRGVRLSDVWGWTDPETGIEYGLIGHLEGTVFIDLSAPSNPRYLGTLPRTEGSPGSTWRDIKVYKDHAFIVADGAREHGMQIFD